MSESRQTEISVRQPISLLTPVAWVQRQRLVLRSSLQRIRNNQTVLCRQWHIWALSQIKIYRSLTTDKLSAFSHEIQTSESTILSPLGLTSLKVYWSSLNLKIVRGFLRSDVHQGSLRLSSAYFVSKVLEFSGYGSIFRVYWG